LLRITQADTLGSALQDCVADDLERAAEVGVPVESVGRRGGSTLGYLRLHTPDRCDIIIDARGAYDDHISKVERKMRDREIALVAE